MHTSGREAHSAAPLGRRLLELKVLGMEGPEGTGSLEQDEQRLAELPGADAGSGSGGGDGGQQRLRAALVYRMGQKRLARAWLVRAKAELQGLLALLRDMDDRLAGLERAKA
jgi:hypothetical protein